MLAFFESGVFSKRLEKLGIDDRTLADLQAELILNPEAGDLIQKSRGLRKIRMGASGRGRRGGARVIYYYFDGEGSIFLLYIFAKNEKSDLNAEEVAVLRKLVEREFE